MNWPLHYQMAAPALGIALAIGIVAALQGLKAHKAKRERRARRLACLQDPVNCRQILSR